MISRVCSLATAALFGGLIRAAIGVEAIFQPSVSATFGIEVAKSGPFYFAVVAPSLTVYLILLVFAVRTWESFTASLRVRFP